MNLDWKDYEKGQPVYHPLKYKSTTTPKVFAKKQKQIEEFNKRVLAKDYDYFDSSKKDVEESSEEEDEWLDEHGWEDHWIWDDDGYIIDEREGMKIDPKTGRKRRLQKDEHRDLGILEGIDWYGNGPEILTGSGRTKLRKKIASKIKEYYGGSIGDVASGTVDIVESVAMGPLILKGLEESGLLDATEKSFGAMADALVTELRDPTARKMRNLWINTIPKLKFQYDKVRNELLTKASGWTSRKISNHQLKAMNLRSKIKMATDQLQATQAYRQALQLDKKVEGGMLTGGNIFGESGKTYQKMAEQSYKIDRSSVGNFQYQKQYSNRDVAVFVNAKKKIVCFAYKGTNTDHISDLIADSAIVLTAFKSSARYKKMVKHFDKVMKHYKGYKVALTGHSLGAHTGTAMYDYANAKGYDAGFVIYNRGSSPLEIYKKGPRSSKKHHHHVTEPKADWISAPYTRNKTVTLHKYKQKANSKSPHAMSNFQ